MSLDTASIRAQFPALSRTVEGRPAIFLDGPAGSQVPESVIDAISSYLRTSNANNGGAFVTSRETGQLMKDASLAMADLVGTDDPDTIVFGPNMTTLTFQFSRALAQTWSDGDEVVVTRLDHDSNVWPWVLAARDAGATVRYVPFHKGDGTLDMEAMAAAIGPQTRLVAVAAASNALGTLNPVPDVVRLAHEHGALVYVDAVHSAPHRLMDAAGWDADFVAFSAYKFYGPHVGIVHARKELLESLPAYQVRPAQAYVPGRWSTGTRNHEGMAGAMAAVEYLAGLGTEGGTRRERLVSAYSHIEAHEGALCRRLIAGIEALPGFRVMGITDPARSDRVATIGVVHDTIAPQELHERLGAVGIFCWAGHFYAVEVTAHLGLDPAGMLRLGVMHYNTTEEIDTVVNELRRI
jgi:cysteine desulfurase family protein (TIGR01976 family)